MTTTEVLDLQRAAKEHLGFGSTMGLASHFVIAFSRPVRSAVPGVD
jgi:hypothetical protein